MTTTSTSPPPRPTRHARRGPRPALWITLLLVVVAVVAALATSQMSGAGAADVGDTGTEPAAVAAPGPAGGTCAATVSNPGGDNNYVPDAPVRGDLGQGFLITGAVRGTDCAPLPGVRVQVWLATAQGGERANRASVLTGPDGVYRISTAPVRTQFGEPNVHVAYDDDEFQPVFLRNVVDEGDTRAVVDLTLAER